MRWCCATLQDWYAAAGERGIGLLIERSTDGRAVFLLQYRSIDPGKEALVSSQTPVTLSGQVGITFCPWCGQNLENWYGEFVDTLVRPQLKMGR